MFPEYLRPNKARYVSYLLACSFAYNFVTLSFDPPVFLFPISIPYVALVEL